MTKKEIYQCDSCEEFKEKNKILMTVETQGGTLRHFCSYQCARKYVETIFPGPRNEAAVFCGKCMKKMLEFSGHCWKCGCGTEVILRNSSTEAL